MKMLLPLLLLSTSPKGLLGANSRTLETVHSPFLTDDHYEVVDVLKQSGFVEREIRRAKMGGAETAKILIPPSGANFINSDTRNWQIDHRHFKFQTMALIAIAPFVVSALDLQGNGENESVLELGLGGGTTDMFLSSVKPKLNVTGVELDPAILSIAQKWFGVTSSENRRQILADGIDVIRRFKESEDKVDVIFLDTSDGDSVAPAPAAAFIKKSVIEDMKELLKPKGVFVANLAFAGPFGRKKAQEGMSKDFTLFSKIFPSCFKMTTFSEIYNDIIVCQKNKIKTSERELRRRAQHVTEKFNLRNPLNGLVFI